MFRNIGWMTFVIVLAVVSNLYGRVAIDQAGRNLAASSDQKIEAIERETRAIDNHQLRDIESLTDRIQGRAERNSDF